MPLPVFFPIIKYIPKIEGAAITLEDVCKNAGADCAAFGGWIKRPIQIVEANEPSIVCEPGDWGCVQVKVPLGMNFRDKSRWALGALAYAVFDGVARASICGKPWARAASPKGRKPLSRLPLTNAQRQRKFRSGV